MSWVELDDMCVDGVVRGLGERELLDLEVLADLVKKSNFWKLHSSINHSLTSSSYACCKVDKGSIPCVPLSPSVNTLWCEFAQLRPPGLPPSAYWKEIWKV
jgi:hypothetical protein